MKVWKFELNGSLLSKAYKVLDEMYRRVISHDTGEESDAKVEEKLAHGFKNDMTYLVKFNASSAKSENLHFDVLLLSIA